MLEELFCAHRAELTAYCRGLCRSDAAAQDMVQEAFLRAWQNIGTLQDLGPSQRRAWLYRTARNLFVDAMRRTAREDAALPERKPAACWNCCPRRSRSYSASATWKATPQRNWEKCTVCRLPPCEPGWPKPADT